MKLKGVVLFAILTSGFFLTLESAESRVPFVRDCVGRDAGQWAFGEGADGCDANRFGSISRIRFIYSDFVFDRSKSDNAEHRKDYVTNVNALLRDLASQYIRVRKPDVQEDEVAAFVEAIRAVAHQETYWSHYRVAARGGHKLATGDRNISHGMMQINQRYHASKDQDRSFDLVGNVGFGIEHFYDEWDAASKTKCIMRTKNQSRAQTLENITRAAYSSYNGGPSAVCRWTNPQHAWAKNDKNYFKKLKGREWSEWVRAEDHKIKIDLECVRSGDELCAVAKERRGEYLASRPLLMENGSTCVTTDGKSLHCAQDLRVFTCLAGLSADVAGSSPLKVKATDRDIVKMSKKFYDNRLELCGVSFPEIATLGDVVTTQVALAIRGTIDGKTVGFTKKGQAFQVLDIEVDLDEKAERYYRIRLSNKVEGWISAGDKMAGEKYVSIQRLGFRAAPARGVSQWLPTKGSVIEVAKVDGLKLLVSPEDSLGGAPEAKAVLAKGSVAEVEEVQISGAANEIWLRVKTAQDVGYIYAGRTYPSSSVEQWIKVK